MAELGAGTRLGGYETGLMRSASRVIAGALSENQHRGSRALSAGLALRIFTLRIGFIAPTCAGDLLLGMCAQCVISGELWECLCTVAINPDGAGAISVAVVDWLQRTI